MPLWFGTGIHYALENYYNPALSRDPVEAFTYWFDLTWKGGRIPESELRYTYDPDPQPSPLANYPSYMVRGLYELLPEDQESEFMEHRELGIRMMQYYRDYAERVDDFRVIAVEHDFSVTIPVPDGYLLNSDRFGVNRDGCLMAFDERIEGMAPVHYRGRMDMIIQDQVSGMYGMMDHKTTSDVPGEQDYELKLEMDEQMTSYLWAAEMEAAIHDLPYTDIDFIVYQAIRKAFPRYPTVTSRAPFFSVDRTKESTTYNLLLEYIEKEGLQVVAENNDKAKAYIEYLKEVGDDQFILRTTVRRNRHQIQMAGQRIFLEAIDMLNNPAIYPNMRQDWSCIRCPFRAPCLAMEDGSDYDWMIETNYEQSRDR
jgi:hypothetical protein